MQSNSHTDMLHCTCLDHICHLALTTALNKAYLYTQHKHDAN